MEKEKQRASLLEEQVGLLYLAAIAASREIAGRLRRVELRESFEVEEKMKLALKVVKWNDFVVPLIPWMLGIFQCWLCFRKEKKIMSSYYAQPLRIHL